MPAHTGQGAAPPPTGATCGGGTGALSGRAGARTLMRTSARRQADRARATAARACRDRREGTLRARQQRHRVDVSERVVLGADAQVQPAVAGRERPDRRPRADPRAGTDADRPQRQVRDAARAAADADDALPGDPAGVDDAAGAGRPDRGARRRGEIDAAVRAGRERRAAGVVERARHLAWDRSQPSLGQGGGGDRRRHQDRGQD